MKQGTTKSGLLKALATHLLMGASLGLICAMVILSADLGHLREFFANEPDPQLEELIFALNLSVAFALSATLTGFVFMQTEKR